MASSAFVPNNDENPSSWHRRPDRPTASAQEITSPRENRYFCYFDRRWPSTNPVAVFVNYYLLVYNTVSALGWSYVLLLTLVHLFNLDSRGSGGSQWSTSTLTRILSSLRLSYATSQGFESRLPPVLQPLYRRAATTYARVGVQTAFIQTAAVLEVVHVLLGLVRSSLLTTAMQVSSRLFLVWGITEQFEVVSRHLRVLLQVLTRQFARLE